MKQLGALLFLLAYLLIASCELKDINKINEQSLLVNKIVQNVSRVLVKELENFHENFKLVIKNISSISFNVRLFYDILKDYKELKLQFIHGVNSCDDLKYRYASSLNKYNKFEFARYDESAAWEAFNKFITKANTTLHEQKEEVRGSLKNVTDLLANKEISSIRNELHELLKNLSTFQQDEIKKAIDNCDCPLNISLLDLSKYIDEYQKILTDFCVTEQAKEEHGNAMRQKMKDIENSITLQEVRNTFDRILSCYSGYPDYYNSNRTFWSEKNNSCFNLEMDLADQDAKIWRNFKITDLMEVKGLQCHSREIQVLDELKNGLKTDEKKLVQEFFDLLVSYKNAYNRHFIRFQAHTKDIEKVYGKIKKIYDENCKCTNQPRQILS